MNDMQNVSKLKSSLRCDGTGVANVAKLKIPERKPAWKPDTVRFTRDELREIIADQID
jgi:hypothetical protein